MMLLFKKVVFNMVLRNKDQVIVETTPKDLVFWLLDKKCIVTFPQLYLCNCQQNNTNVTREQLGNHIQEQK